MDSIDARSDTLTFSRIGASGLLRCRPAKTLDVALSTLKSLRGGILHGNGAAWACWFVNIYGRQSLGVELVTKLVRVNDRHPHFRGGIFAGSATATSSSMSAARYPQRGITRPSGLR